MRSYSIPHTFAFLWLSSALSFSPLLGQDTSSHQLVWHWFTTSSQSETLRVRVTFKGKSIYRSSFPVAKIERGRIQPERPQKILEFSFNGEPKIFDTEFNAYPFQRITGNIWEAGCDPNDILLGVSFDIPKRILLNTIHIALIGQVARSQLAEGLFIETIPLHVKAKRATTPPGH